VNALPGSVRRPLTLAQRLAFAFTLLALFAAGLTGYFAYRDGRRALVVTAEEQLATATRVLGRRIALTLDGVENDLTLLARHPDSLRALNGDRESMRHTATLFQRLLASHNGYFQIRLIAADGREVVRIDRGPGGPLVVAEEALQEKGHLPYVYETLALPPSGIYLSPPEINQEHGAHDAEGQPSVQIAMRIENDAGDGDPKAAGIVVINVDLDGLFRLLSADLPADTEVFLTNSQGDFLIHPNPELAFAFARGRRARAQDSFPQTAPLFGGSADQETVTFIDGGSGRISSFVRVEMLPGVWRSAAGQRGVSMVLGLAQPFSGVLAESGTLAVNAARNALIAGILAALLAYFVARAATASLRQIEEAMTHFARGGAVDLPTERNDEIGTLARRFAAMQEQIKAQLITLEAQRQALDHEAQHDWLTGLDNRRSLIGMLPQALARASRQHGGVTLFFIDLDGFKPINDSHGHSVGDQVLIEIAQRLREGVRAGDFIARPGGDEFVVVCEGLRTPDEATSVAEKLIGLINQPVVVDGAVLRVGASVGIATFPHDGRDAEALTGAADRAMYAAKSAGRGVWRLARESAPEPPEPQPPAK